MKKVAPGGATIKQNEKVRYVPHYENTLYFTIWYVKKFARSKNKKVCRPQKCIVLLRQDLFFLFLEIFSKNKKRAPYYRTQHDLYQSYPRQVSGRGPSGRNCFPTIKFFSPIGVPFSWVTRERVAGVRPGNVCTGNMATSVGKAELCVGILDPSGCKADDISKYMKQIPTNKSWNNIFIPSHNIYSTHKIKSFYDFLINVQLMGGKLVWHLKKVFFGIWWFCFSSSIFSPHAWYPHPE